MNLILWSPAIIGLAVAAYAYQHTRRVARRRKPTGIERLRRMAEEVDRSYAKEKGITPEEAKAERMRLMRGGVIRTSLDEED